MGDFRGWSSKRRGRIILAVFGLIAALVPLTTTSIAPVQAAPGDVLYRVNAGASTVPAIDGGPDWIADTATVPPVLVAGGSSLSSGLAVPGATVPASTPPGLFSVERWDPSWGSEMAYEFAVPAGTSVEVRMFLANSWWGTASPGTRVFDILVDGVLVADDLDLSVTFGHRVGGMISTTIVSDGTIDIDFARVAQNPLVNGFEIVEAGTPGPHTLTVTETGSGTVTVDPDLAQYPHDTSVQLTATPDPGWVFSGWTGDLVGPQNPAPITMDRDLVIEAIFDQLTPAVLTTTVVGNGTITAVPDLPNYYVGDVVDLTATPAPGWEFSGWSGDLTGAASPATVTMAATTDVTATFTAIPTYTLDVLTSGPGSVTVSPDLPTYLTGDVVTLTANPDPGNDFTGWSGDLTGTTNPDTVTITANASVTANFAATPTYTMSVLTNGPGTVTVSPDQPTYLAGDVVTLTANPDAGASFTGWSGDLTGTTNPDTITITSNAAVSANFLADPVLVLDPIADVNVLEGGNEVVPVSASGPSGISLAVSGEPSFVSFTDSGGGVGTLTVAPGVGDAGVYPGVSVTATAGAQADTSTFTIVVTEEPGSNPGQVLYRVNAGTTTVPAVDGGADWIADTAMTPPVLVAGGNSLSNSSAVPGATVPNSTPPALFNVERWDPSWGPEMAWEFPVPTGTEVEVRVFMANSWWGTASPGKRVFDLLIDGTVVADDLDLSATFGHLVGGMVSTTVVSDGVIDIDFARVLQNPLVNGFEIVESDGTTPPPLVLNAVGDIAVDEGDTAVVAVTASGPSGIALSLAGAPPFATLDDAGDGTGTLTVSPAVGDAGTYPGVSVIATAGAQTVSSTFTITVDEPVPTDVHYRVNAGGPLVPSTDSGPDWSADNSSSPSQWVNHGTGNQSFFSVPGGTVTPVPGYPQALFDSERYDPIGGNVMQWEFPVASGTSYDVTLLFSEKFYSASGSRQFDVQIEGQPILVDFDPSVPTGVDVGTASTSVVLVADDYITIDFARGIGDPNIDAIEISLHDGTADVPPVVAPIADVVLDAGTSVDIAVSATDQQPIVLTLANAPSFASLVDNGDGTGTITVAPALGDVGNYPDVELIATANGLSTTELFSITVDDPGGVAPGVLYRVNAGGPTIAANDGGPDWLNEASMTPATRVAGGENVSSSTAAPGPTVPSTTPAQVFSTERWDPSFGAEMSWEFAVPAGTQVEVRVFAGDGYSGTSAPGARVFDINLDGASWVPALDLSGTYGPSVGVMFSTTIVSDGVVDIDFQRQVQNPLVNAFEIIVVDAPETLGASPSSVDFGTVTLGNQPTQSIVLTNLGQPGDPTITGVTASVDPGAFSVVTPPVANLAAGASTTMVVEFAPTATGADSATVTVAHSGVNSPMTIGLQGSGVDAQPISFTASGLPGTGIGAPTSLEFGPDGRLYVSQQNGQIKAFTISRNGASDYSIVATETITEIQGIVNHDDDGTVSTETGRQVTGLMTAGTASNPVLYVSSSDPRIAGGGTGADAGLDTNSGVLSRLTWNGSGWDHVQLIRGLPRSEENHSTNGMDLDTTTGTLYLQSGGFTNKGAPSNNFAGTPEYALSAALLAIDLTAIEAMPTLTDGNGADYKYDLPTLNDPLRADKGGSQPTDPDADVNDPWGGNDGLNQAILVQGGPVQVHATGFRNAYDVVQTQAGRLYTWDNGPNSGWGGIPVGDGTPACTNEMNENGSAGKPDGLHHITGAGYYGGHPNPTRGNADSGIIQYVKSGPGWTVANAYAWSDFPVPPVPASMIDPAECTYLSPASPTENGALATVGASTNGITEYTATNFGGALQGDLLGASFNGSIYRSVLTEDGTALVSNDAFLQGFGSTPLDVTALGDADPFPGTIWAVTYGSNAVTVFEPADYDGGGGPVCIGGPGAIDEDGDGYTNDDELAAGTDPCNAGSKPADADGDFISDVTDPDDDNDGITDLVDLFAVDADNGTSTLVAAACPTDFSDESVPSCLRFSAGQRAGTILDLGVTGVMTNGSDYLQLFDPDNMIAGGAAGALAVQITESGTPFGGANDAEYGFQHGVVVPNEPFVVRSRLKSPFPSAAPQTGQIIGIQIGDGTQGNFAALTVTGDGADGIVSLDVESADVTTSIGTVTANDVIGSVDTDLIVTLDPVAGTITAEYQVGAGTPTTVATAPLTASWFTPGSVVALGLVSSSGAAAPFTASWDYLDAERVNPPSGTTSADFDVLSGNNNMIASTFLGSSFSITNTSTSGAEIISVSYDLSTGWMSNMVFDPFGTAGDTTAKGFTIDSGSAAVGFDQFSYELPHNGVDGDAGYDGLDVQFTDFDASETFTFSIDVDPTSINGDPPPGTNDSGSVSGLELVGVEVTIAFSDGQTLTSTLFGEGTNAGAVGAVTTEPAPADPTISIAGSPGNSTSTANHDLIVTGPTGATVHLVHAEAGLFLPSPLGSADRELGDPLLSNSIISQSLSTTTIGAGGSVTIPVTLLSTDPDGGFNQFAVIVDVGGVSSRSDTVAIRYTP